MATYDASVIITFTDNLYAQAGNVVATYSVIGVLVGGAVGAVIANVAHIAWPMVALAGAAIVGAVAFQLGQQKAFSLRLQAQIALCQVQIEANTRNLR